MAPDVEFRKDLYRGTAAYYDRYRKPYPGALLDDLIRRTGVTSSGRLLDLACGTGQVSLPLARRFASVVAVDQERESVEYASAKATRLGIGNVTWVAGSAETADLDGRFELITVGNAFHRLRRDAVASRMRSWLTPGGGVALVWGDMPWVGGTSWQAELLQLFIDWVDRMHVADRVPAGFEKAMEQDPHESVLRRAGFDYLGKFEFPIEQLWSLEELTGHMYSTSLLNRAVLEERSREFEADLARRLLEVEPTGRFIGPACYAYELAVAPAR